MASAPLSYTDITLVTERFELVERRKKDLITTLSVLLVVVFIVTGVIITKKNSRTDSVSSDSTTASAAPVASSTQAANDPVSTPATTDATASSNTSGFKDGTYSATGFYSTPENTENIKLSITLKDGTVTGTSATVSASTRDSQEYAGAFVQNYKPLVIGKSITSIKLSRVSGSSLTSQGFNDAIQQIETQAKV